MAKGTLQMGRVYSVIKLDPVSPKGPYEREARGSESERMQQWKRRCAVEVEEGAINQGKQEKARRWDLLKASGGSMALIRPAGPLTHLGVWPPEL